jgi:hypothetical protein
VGGGGGGGSRQVRKYGAMCAVQTANDASKLVKFG